MVEYRVLLKLVKYSYGVDLFPFLQGEIVTVFANGQKKITCGKNTWDMYKFFEKFQTIHIIMLRSWL